MTAFPRFYCILFCASALALCGTEGRTATLLVDLGGAGDFTAIQPAIDSAQPGDTVLVKAGEYVITEPITFKGKAITVKSESGAGATTVRMSETPADSVWGSVVQFDSGETAASVLEGFTVTSTDSWQGGTIAEYPVSPFGVACLYGSSPTLTNCTISGNTGGGVICGDGLTPSTPTLTNCTISGNIGGGVFCTNSSPTLTNCTISANKSGYEWSSGVYCQVSSSPTLTNCIAWDNGGPAIRTDADSHPIVSYCCFESTEVWPGTGNINLDPQFCGWDAGEVWVDGSRLGPGTGTSSDPYSTLSLALGTYRFRLKAGSPCLGTGKGGGDMGAADGLCRGDGLASIVVHLAPGTYPIAGNLLHRVSLEGAGQEATVIEGTVYGLQTGAVLSGVKITRGGPVSGGLVVSPGAAPEIRDCTISGNTGSGVACAGSAPTLINCTISGNSASGSGGGVYCYHSSPTLSNCTISGNSSAGFGGGVYCENSSPTLTNCTISGNTGGGVIRRHGADGSSPRLTNCTISGNIGFGVSGAGTIANCIVWGNVSGFGSDYNENTGVISHSCIEGAEPLAGVGNINTDPQFCGWPTTDVWVDARRVGPGTGTQGNPYAALGSALSSYGLSLQQGSPCLGTGEGGSDMGAPLGTCAAGGPSIRNVHLAPGTYAIEGFNLSHDVSIEGSGQESTVILGTVNGLRTGAVLSGVTITQGGRPSRQNGWETGGIVLVSGESPAIRNCTITGNSAFLGGGVYCESSSPRLTNCTISGNSAVGGTDFGGFGSGVYCRDSSPTLTNCTISGNSASGSGGGVHYDGESSSPTLSNCTISGNSAGTGRHSGSGGGVSCSGFTAPTLTNCTISGNSASGSGGGVYCYLSSPTLTNCTISGNWAGRHGGVSCYYFSSPTLTNCILWDNAAGTIGKDDDTNNPIVSYSCIAGGWPGDGNIDQDPSFVQPGHFEDSDGDGQFDAWIPGDYHLQPGSPCIDTGTCVGAPPLDIEGNTRPAGKGCDMGVYEFGAPPALLFRRGDANADAQADISDAIATLGFLFLGSPKLLSCEKSADTNDDGKLDLSDPVALLNHLFLGAQEPPQPFPDCGTDGTEDGLGCESPEPCA